MNSFSEKAKQTIQRHKFMSCKSFELKIDKSSLSKTKFEFLNRLFLEAKWFQNYIVSTKDIFHFDTKTNKVIVLNKEHEKEEREIICLSSQEKQSVQQKLENAVKALSAIKKKNATLPKKQRKIIGKIKFTSNVKAIVLNQFNITYRFKDNKYLILQGSKLKFKIEGLKQIPENAEITCSTLTHRHNDFYLKVTCFLPKEQIKYKENNSVVENSVGIDFGCMTTLTLSNRKKKNLKIKENLRLRRASRKRSKKPKKVTKNYIKQINLVNKLTKRKIKRIK